MRKITMKFALRLHSKPFYCIARKYVFGAHNLENLSSHDKILPQICPTQPSLQNSHGNRIPPWKNDGPFRGGTLKRTSLRREHSSSD